MSVTLYVGNLAWGVTEDELAQAFETVGEVKEVRIITDPQTGRSRGFGFVEMNGVDAAAAIAQLHGRPLKGRALLVSSARERASPPEEGGPTTRMSGRVKWFSDAKGYGFVETAEGDVFVHYSVIEGAGFRSLREGQKVELEVRAGPRGTKAAWVRTLKDEG